MEINPRATEIQVPGIRVYSNQVNVFEDGINLTIGQPDFPTPEKVKSAAIKAIENDLTGYSHNAGLVPLRTCISDFFNECYSGNFASENVVVTNGASEALDSVLRTLMVADDEIIILSPAYPGYESLVTLNNGIPILLDTSHNGFKPDIEQLEQAITPRTKAVIFNYPSNPTGISLTKDDMSQLANFLKEKDIFIISDEIYSENSFLDQHVSFASFPEIKDQTFIIHGLSKSHSMTGWRMGYVLGPPNIMKHVLKIHLNNSICASMPSQYAAIEALTHGRHYPEAMNKQYIERRDYLYEELTNLGFSVSKPTGAFYIFPDISSSGLDDVTFADRLLEEEHVAVVPGSTFTQDNDHYVRISYANSLDNLKEGISRIYSFLNRL
jgi:aminotransferase